MTTTNHPPSRPAGPAVFIILLFAAGMLAVAAWMGTRIYAARQADPPGDEVLLWPILVWAASNGIIAGLLSLRQLIAKSIEPSYDRGPASDWQPTPPAKILVLAVGGALGFTTVLLGIAVAMQWWDTLSGGRMEWKNWEPWIPIGLILSGIAVMFCSLLAVRSEERNNPIFRRLIYGYNAILTGLLVLAILGVGNVMAHFYATHHFDWTEGSIYSLAPQSIRILEELEEPVQVYSFLSPLSPTYQDVQTLLKNCESYSDKIEIITPKSTAELRELFQQHEIMDDTALLILTEFEGKEISSQLRPQDLVEVDSGFSGQDQSQSFKGEQALMSAIAHLRGGKVALTVYFTQGSGEFDLNDRLVPNRLPKSHRGMGQVKEKLEKSNYTVKEFHLGRFDSDTNQPVPIPEDAFAVVLASPTDLGSPEATAAKVKVLEDYMKRPDGHLIVLVGSNPTSEGQIRPTGLEGLLSSFGVQVGNDIILHPPAPTISMDPTEAIVGLSATADAAFREGFSRASSGFPMLNARSVKASTPPGNYAVSPLMETVQILRVGTGQWAETSLRGSPTQFVERLISDQSLESELRTKLTSPATSIAVTVREKSDSPPRNPNDPHAFMQQQDGAPRMVVFGSPSIVGNYFVEQRSDIYFNLFLSSLSWLRERPELITDIEPKERKFYRLSLTPEQSTRVKYLPITVLLMGIVASGVGVWLVRRR